MLGALSSSQVQVQYDVRSPPYEAHQVAKLTPIGQGPGPRTTADIISKCGGAVLGRRRAAWTSPKNPAKWLPPAAAVNADT